MAAYNLDVKSIKLTIRAVVTDPSLIGPKGPKGDDAPQPFKGWFEAGATETSNLPANPTVGDYAYVQTVDGEENPVTKVYDCVTTGTWHDSGRTVDTSNVQVFKTLQKVNEVSIVNDCTTGGENDVLSAEQGKVLKQEITQLDQEVNGIIFGPLGTYDKKNWHLNSRHVWKSSDNDEVFIIPVTSGDIVTATYRGTSQNSRGIRILVADYPSLNSTAVNLLDSDQSPSDSTSETLSISSNGYLCVWKYYMDATNNRFPTQLSINGVDQFAGVQSDVTKLKSDVEDLQTEVGGLQDDIDDLYDKIGEVHTEEIVTETQIATTTTTFVVNQTGTVDLYPAETPIQIPVGNKCRIWIQDNNNIIKKTKSGKAFSIKINGGDQISCYDLSWDTILNYQFTTEVAITSLRVYLTQGQRVITNYGDIILKIYNGEVETVITPVMDYVDENDIRLSNEIKLSKILSHNDMFGLESNWWIEEMYLEDKYSTDEQTALTTLRNKFTARAGAGKYQIVAISDTHGSGAYTWKSIYEVNRHQASCYRSIAVFNKILPECNAGIHCGDLSCDYGTSRIRDLQYMIDIVRRFKAGYNQTSPFDPGNPNNLPKPLFITKGNHDENNDGYIEVDDVVNLDWNNTYYTRKFNTFTQVTSEAAWDGSPLYIAKQELVSDTEFRNTVQHWMSPATAVWGNGAYYYYDDETFKIRIIVANSFPVNNEHVVSEDEEYRWFAEEALNLGTKNNPQEWQVIVIRHTESTSLSDLSDCINAFQNGTTWTYGTGESAIEVNFGTQNGGGCTFIAHIHGHEHTNCVSNAEGYFDIGENISSINLDKIGQADKYGISVFTIDTANKMIYEDNISGDTWMYDYSNNKIVMNIGDTIKAAKSGLASPTGSSSNTSVVTVDNTDEGVIVTAVGVGEASVTVTKNSASFTYYFKVVN